MNAALDYASRGFQVIRLTPRQKIPFKGSKGCKDATCDPEIIKSWWDDSPTANIGLAMGNGIFALDFDVKNGQQGAATLQSLISQGLPLDTLNSTTPTGGFHYLFRAPAGTKIPNSAGKLPGLDIRCDGGYIVAAPSVTDQGAYVWNNPDAAILDAPPFLLDLVTKNKSASKSKSSTIAAGGRNDTLFKLTCSLIQKGLDPLAIRAAVMKENELKCIPPLPDGEIDLILTAAERYRTETPERQETLTDLGNAERLNRKHGENIRYVPERKKWMAWNKSRWSSDLTSGIYLVAIDTVKTMVQEALTLPDEQRTALIRHSLKSQSAGALSAMIEIASKLSGIPIRVSELDANPYLFNVLNGTIDLKTGICRAARRDDFITKQSPIEYDATAECPVFLKFLHEIMGGNKNLIAYLKRWIGYLLTGCTAEQVLAFFFGHGANGKSVLLNVISALGGDYAMQAAPEILMVRDKQGASPELARLVGARFVATSETEDNQKFAEAAIKQMTGQDVIVARSLYCEPIEFVPQFKIILAANHKPVIKGTDEAIWRRIHLVPFNVTIPAAKRDKNLDAKLRKELPGILNWAIAGCLEWQEVGLQPPDEVLAAVKEYRNDMDIIGQWLDECCVIAPKGAERSLMTRAGKLYHSYNEWSMENVGWSLTQTRFGRTLAERGFIKGKDAKGQRAWEGIGLLYTGY
jgi:putative DNA primase/helicase